MRAGTRTIGGTPSLPPPTLVDTGESGVDAEHPAPRDNPDFPVFGTGALFVTPCALISKGDEPVNLDACRSSPLLAGLHQRSALISRERSNCIVSTKPLMNRTDSALSKIERQGKGEQVRRAELPVVELVPSCTLGYRPQLRRTVTAWKIWSAPNLCEHELLSEPKNLPRTVGSPQR